MHNITITDVQAFAAQFHITTATHPHLASRRRYDYCLTCKKRCEAHGNGEQGGNWDLVCDECGNETVTQETVVEFNKPDNLLCAPALPDPLGPDADAVFAVPLIQLAHANKLGVAIQCPRPGESEYLVSVFDGEAGTVGKADTITAALLNAACAAGIEFEGVRYELA